MCTVTVSLVYNPSRGEQMNITSNYSDMKDIIVDVEKGKNYYLGAKVNLKASRAEQQDGSFCARDLRGSLSGPGCLSISEEDL